MVAKLFNHSGKQFVAQGPRAFVDQYFPILISLFIPRTLIIAVQLLQSYFAPCQKLTRFASNALLLLFNVPFLLLYSSALEPKLSEHELNFGRGLNKFGCKGQIGKEREKSFGPG